MPRRPRRFIPGVTYHLIARFVDREWFIETELERRTYLELLGAALAKSTWKCFAYAVMSNHIHLAVIAGVEPLWRWIQTPHSKFADLMNRSRGRIGNVFTRGPKDILIPDERIGQVLAYIHNNPVRAKLVSEAAGSAWTSHRFYTQSEPAPKWLAIEQGLQSLSSDVRGRDAFDAFVRSNTAHPVLGNVETDEQFARKLEDYERQQIALLERPAPRQVSMDTILSIATEEMGISVEQLLSGRRGGAETTARRAIVRSAVHLGVKTAELSDSLRITRQAVSKIMLGDASQEVVALEERVTLRAGVAARSR